MYIQKHSVLFGLRTKQEHDESVPNADALEMFRDYFGALTPDTSEQDALKTEIEGVKTENIQLSKELVEVKGNISVLR